MKICSVFTRTRFLLFQGTCVGLAMVSRIVKSGGSMRDWSRLGCESHDPFGPISGHLFYHSDPSAPSFIAPVYVQPFKSLTVTLV